MDKDSFQQPDIAHLWMAFNTILGKESKKDCRPDGKGFIALNVVKKLQWNSDYDPEERCAKFGINVEEKRTMRLLFESERRGFERDLLRTLSDLPSSIKLRIYRHNNKFEKRHDIIYEEDVCLLTPNSIKTFLGKVRNLLETRSLPGHSTGYPKPHFHLFKIIWKSDEDYNDSIITEEMKKTYKILTEVMDLLKSHI